MRSASICKARQTARVHSAHEHSWIWRVLQRQVDRCRTCFTQVPCPEIALDAPGHKKRPHPCDHKATCCLGKASRKKGKRLERAAGIEPASSAWKTGVQNPKNHFLWVICRNRS